MLKLGLTGGIGAGKSTVSQRLAERGAVIVDADRLARELVEPGTPGLREVVAAFGGEVLTPDGALDRAALGRRVFADEGARLRLNAILHPRIGALTEERMAAAGPDAIVVHDVPLLVENRMGAAYHLVLVVQAGVAERVRRLVADRGMTAADAAARVAAQADDDARRAAADVWLDNSGDRAALVAQVEQVWDERIVPFARNLRERRAVALPRPVPVPSRRAAQTAQVARLAARVARAGGDAVLQVDHAGATAGDGPPSPDVIDLQVAVRDGAAGDVVRALADAGFFPVDGPESAAPPIGAAPGGVVLGGADPGCPVRVLVIEAPGRPEACAGRPAGRG